MKIFFIDNPVQHKNTIEPQLIDGRVVHWIVVSECMKANETLKEWLIRKKERINSHPNYSSVEGILIYDIRSITSASSNESSMIVRYAYLRS